MRFLALCLCVLTLSACNADNDPANPSPTPPPVPTPTPTPPPPVDYSAVIRDWRQRLPQQLAALNLKGAAVAVVDGDRVVWSEGFGLANVAQRSPASADTLFRIGSVSKLFTATAVMQQVEARRAWLDQPLAAQLPGFVIRSRFGTQPTLRQLLSHHAGVPEQARVCSGRYDAALTQCASGIELAHAPGDQYAYSNLGLDLAGALVAQLTGQPFVDGVRNTVLGPLGMSTSDFRLANTPAALRALAYDGDTEIGEQPEYDDMPAGGMWSSANEMTHFMRMALARGRLGGNVVIQPETLEAMWQVQNHGNALDLDCRNGLGWFTSACGVVPVGDGIRVVQHSGSTGFFNTQLMLLPDLGLGVFITVNGADQGMVQQVASDLAADLVTRKTGQRPKRTELPAAQFTAQTSDDLQRYPGWYYVPLAPLPSAAFRIEAQGDALRMVSADPTTPPRTLRRDREGWQRMEGVDTMRLRLETLNGRPQLVYQTKDERGLMASRLPALTLSPAWQQRLATPVDVGGIEVGWIRQDDLLVLTVAGEPAFAITPIDDDSAVVAGDGRGRGDVIRFTAGGVTYQGLPLDLAALTSR
ncbi:serine hydrolase domain-containing protein [Chitinibacteraceae bacterium HSL-7]